MTETYLANQKFNVCSSRTYSLFEALHICVNINDFQLQVVVSSEFVRAGEVIALCGGAQPLRSVLPKWQTPPLAEALSLMLDAG